MDIENGLKYTINIYHAQGLKVTQIYANNEFAYIQEEVRPENLNIVAAEDHVGNIERSGRTIKEGTQWNVHRLPYVNYSK